MNMAKPKWFLQGIAIMSVFLYSVDVGSDFWVGIDLYLRCHYHYAATVFTWILVPGFIYGWVIFFQGGVECYWKAVLKAQIREQMSGPDLHVFTHGLRTPNEGIYQRYLKIWADVADKICCRHT